MCVQSTVLVIINYHRRCTPILLKKYIYCTHTCIYMYTHTCMYIYIYTYVRGIIYVLHVHVYAHPLHVVLPVFLNYIST